MNDQLFKWHLSNCGLIIVHPFLLHLFKNLNYLNEKNQFNSVEEQWRAVYLVHYLGSGENIELNESELAMSKILCGMEIQQDVPPLIKLKKNEINNADELLVALIEHWKKLGRTSPDALRNTFIKRSGMLEAADNTLQITVESSGTDVLLDFIPWNINLIKLPWIKKIIYVSWR